ncbi:hypothetical protein D9M70_449510 [compost metagenome]
MQLATGACVAQPRPEGAKEAFRENVVLRYTAPPPQERRDHEDIADDIDAIGDGCSGPGEQQAAKRRTDRAGDVDAERIQRHGALDVLPRDELRHDRLPGGGDQCRPYAADEGQRDQRAHGLQARGGEKQQTEARQCEQKLHQDQEFAPIENIRENPCRNGEQEDRQGRRRLDHGNGGRRRRQVGNEPGAGDITDETAGIADDRRHPQDRKDLLPQRRKRPCALFRCCHCPAFPADARSRRS